MTAAGMICPPDHKHARTGSCYARHDCRCTPCRKRESARARPYDAAIRKRNLLHGGEAKTPAWPIQRRLQALAAVGYTTAAIERMTGIGAHYLGRIQNGHVRSVMVRRTAVVINRAFMEYGLQVADVTQASSRARNLAASKGWVPAAVWANIDDPLECPQVRRK